MSKRRMDQAYREEQRYNCGIWDEWDGWKINPNPPPPPPLPSGYPPHPPGYSQPHPHNPYPQPPLNNHKYENGTSHIKQYRWDYSKSLTMTIMLLLCNKTNNTSKF